MDGEIKLEEGVIQYEVNHSSTNSNAFWRLYDTDGKKTNIGGIVDWFPSTLEKDILEDYQRVKKEQEPFQEN